ncbi:unnamed protein product, partial [Rotaria magnacalcarata]
YIADATLINCQGKQNAELIRLSNKSFKSNNTLIEKDLYALYSGLLS